MALALTVFPGGYAPAGETWDGGGADDNWTTGANWDAVEPFRLQFPPPNNGTANIVMPAVTGLVQTPIVDVPYSINSLAFNSDGGNGRFVILGAEELTIGAGGIINNDADIQSIIGPVKLSANQTWNAAVGALQMDYVNLNGFQLTLAGARQISLPSAIVGAGGVTIANTYTSTVTMSGGISNSYTGETTVENGTLTLQKSSGATAVPGQLSVESGATARLGADEQIAHTAGSPVYVNGAGGLLDLNGHTETVYQLSVSNNGSVTTGAGMLKIANILQVTLNGSLTGNMSLSDAYSAIVQSNGQVTTGSNLFIGDARNATLNINTGGDVSNDSAYIGYQPGVTGAATVNGIGSTWTNSGFLAVGEHGMGSLTVTMGGHVSNTHATVGQTGSGTALVAGPGSTWTNTSFLEVGNSGTGTLTIEDGGAVSNANAIIGQYSGSQGTVVVRGTNSTWTNSGPLQVGIGGIGILSIEAGGNVTVAGGASVNSTSQINVSGGTFSAMGNLTVAGGSLTADADAAVSFVGGTFQNGASVTVQNGASLTHTGTLDLVSDVTMLVVSGATYAPAFTRVGTQTGPAAELLVDGAGTEVNSSFAIDVGYGGTGVMTITGGAHVNSPNGAVSSFAQDSIGMLTIDGTDASGSPSSWVCGNGPNLGYHATGQGTIHVLNGGLLRSTMGMDVGDPGGASVLVNGASASGSPSLLDAAALTIAMSDVTASGGGRIESGPIVLTPADGTATLTVTGPGSALVQGGASTIAVGNATSGSGVINVQNGATLTSGTGAINVYATGQINLESGAVVDAHGPINLNGGQFNFLGGTLHVDAFNGNLLNEGGTLAPGHSVGTTAVAGNYTQRPAAALEIEIASVFPGDWDVLAVEGNAILEGTIKVVLRDAFEPVLGNSFTIITTNVGNVGGQFDTQQFPIFNGLTFDVIYNAKNVVLQVIEAALLAGDYNNNGVVDAADYVVWRDNEGTSNTLPNDPIGGAIGQPQYDQWRAHFGQTPGTGSAAATTVPVPEPRAITFAIILAACLPFFGARIVRRPSV